jgi:hypothetical protein
MSIKSKVFNRFFIPALISLLWFLFPLYKEHLISWIPFICAEFFYRLLLLNLILISFSVGDYLISKDKKIVLNCILSIIGFVFAILLSYINNNCIFTELANAIPLIIFLILYRNRLIS